MKLFQQKDKADRFQYRIITVRIKSFVYDTWKAFLLMSKILHLINYIMQVAFEERKDK